MPIIAGILYFIILMAVLSKAAPAVGSAIDTVLGLGFMIFVASLVFRFITAAGRRIEKGARVVDYLFVEHPAEPTVNEAVRRGKRLDTGTLQHALTPSESALDLDKPLYHYENQTKKARALKQKLDQDTEIAQAAIRRERTRAELEECERDVRKSRRRQRSRSS
jgi:hypothetical protein